MKFIIFKTSDGVNSKFKPHDNAYEGTYKRRDKYKRLNEKPCWLIDIESMDNLIELIASYDEVVMEDGLYPHPSIEIYDDYRE